GFRACRVVEFSGALASRFVILACGFASRIVKLARFRPPGLIIFGRLSTQLLRGFSGAVDAFAGGIGDVVAQLFTRLRSEQQRQHSANSCAYEKKRQLGRNAVAIVTIVSHDDPFCLEANPCEDRKFCSSFPDYDCRDYNKWLLI